MKSHRLVARRPRMTVARAVLLSVLVAMCCVGLVTGAAQSTKKKEREAEDKIPKHVPIKIKLNKPEKFKDLDNEDWLADLEIEVTNTGTKPIYYLSFVMEFVDVKKDSGDRLGFVFTYGRAKMIEVDEQAKPEDVPIEPGGTHVFKLHQDYVDGWRWYRTQVEQKPHPKKVVFFFRSLSFGDGTGYVTNGAVFVPEPRKPRSSYKSGPDKRWAVTADAGWPTSRPPNPTSQLTSHFLPAAFAPVNLFPARANASAAADKTPPQTCCPNQPCERMRVASGGNCFCPVDNPVDGGHIELDTSSCNTAGFECATAIFTHTNCGSGVTFRTCVSVTLDFDCGEEPPPPPPPPDPCAFPCSASCRQECINSGGQWCWSGCPSGGECECRLPPPPPSPVLFDVAGDGFRLTDAAGGVSFDLDSNGRAERLAWTRAASDDAWLALDRDGDGRIANGRELFGNFTPQAPPPAGAERNGFLALAEFDKSAQGGNSDGVIDARDSVFASLRLWRDANHDGVSQGPELHALAALDVVGVQLDYKESKRTDEYGNLFRYRAKVWDAKGAKAGRPAWDVFLTGAP